MPTNKEEKAQGWVSISEVLGYFVEPALVDWKVRVGAKEAKRIGTVATKIGTRTHELIEDEYRGKFIKFTPKDGQEVKSCIEAYRKWQEDFGFKIEEMEVEVRDEATKLLGHYDIYGQRTLIDIKTSSRLNDKMWLQVNQYAKMRGGCEHVAILRLDKSLAIYEFEKRRVDQRCLEVFDAMLTTYRYFNNDPMGQGESMMATVKVVLPSQPSEAQNLWIEQKTGIIGPPGIGKSEFFSHNPKTLYIQCEAGLGHLKVMKVPVRSWAEWEGTWTALSQANQAGAFPYDTIVIDTIDRFVDYANEETCERGRQKYKSADINVVGDIPNGAGWAWSTDLVMNALGKLEALPAHIVYIGHLDRKEIKQPNQVSIHLQTISIGGKTGRELVAWPDHLLNIQTSIGGTSQKRVVKTIPSSTLEAKSRGGVVKNDWEWSTSSKENWDKFRALFS